MPKVDILIPCLNAANTLKKTLHSIKNQSFQDFRVILVDNCSFDESVHIFHSEMAGFNSAIRIHNTQVSAGESFNRCLDYVESDYFCIMHSDDEYLDNYLETMVSVLDENLDVQMSYCNTYIIDENSTVKFSFKNYFKQISSRQIRNPISGLEGLKWNASFDKIMAPTMFFRKTVIAQYGFFNINFEGVLDWEYIFRLLKGGCKIYFVDSILLKYRIHNQQQTYLQTVNHIKYKEQIRLINIMSKYLEEKFNHKIMNRFFYVYVAICKDFLIDLLYFRFKSAVRRISLLFDIIFLSYDEFNN